MTADARETWPSHDLIESWLGDSMYDFQFRPGEDVVVDADDPEAVAAARQFRDVLGRFASGVTVVTAMSGGAPVGLTCQSFSSASRSTRRWCCSSRPRPRAPGRRSSAPASSASTSSPPTRPSSPTRWPAAGSTSSPASRWAPAPATGSPMIEGTLGYVDCQIHTRPRGRRPLRRHRPGARPRRVHDAEQAAAVLPGQVRHHRLDRVSQVATHPLWRPFELDRPRRGREGRRRRPPARAGRGGAVRRRPGPSAATRCSLGVRGALGDRVLALEHVGVDRGAGAGGQAGAST